MVSDKDRASAIEAANNAFDAWDDGAGSLAAAMVEGLIALDWGPRPTVSPTKLGEFIDAANAGGMAVPWRGLQDYLRECGIEVTE